MILENQTDCCFEKRLAEMYAANWKQASSIAEITQAFSMY